MSDTGWPNLGPLSSAYDFGGANQNDGADWWNVAVTPPATLPELSLPADSGWNLTDWGHLLATAGQTFASTYLAVNHPASPSGYAGQAPASYPGQMPAEQTPPATQAGMGDLLKSPLVWIVGVGALFLFMEMGKHREE